MRRLFGNTQKTSTPQISAHDKKMESRLNSVLALTNKLQCTRREKFIIMLTLINGGVVSDDKLLSNVSIAKINSFLTEYPKILGRSKKEKNISMLHSMVIDTLAQNVLVGKNCDEYARCRNSRMSAYNLYDWLLTQLEEPSPPTVRPKTKSDQVLTASNSCSTNGTGNLIPDPFIPDETLSAIEEVLQHSSGDSASTFSESSAYPRSQRSSQGAQPFQSQPQPLHSAPSTSPSYKPLSGTAATPGTNQPAGAQPTQYPTTPSYTPASGIPSSAPQFHSPKTTRDPLPTHNSSSASTASVAAAMLSNQGMQKVSEAMNLVIQCGFNHDGYLILLQYLITGEIPANLYTESQRPFLQQFAAFTQSITALRNSVNISEQRLWSDQLALKIVHQVFGLSAREALAAQIDRNGVNREEIARWIPMNLHQE